MFSRYCHHLHLVASGYIDLNGWDGSTKRRYIDESFVDRELCMNVDYTSPNHCTDMDDIACVDAVDPFWVGELS